MKRLAIKIVFPLLAATLLAAPVAFCGQPQGAADITLSGGVLGDVPFPHRRHQETETDCAVCHELFPQTSGAIEKQKGSGSLEDKEVMNTLCLACHRDKKRSGLPSGPTRCSQCHQR